MRYAVFVVYLSFAVIVNVVTASEIDLPDLGDSAGSVISPEQKKNC